jgi:hypothetical protein
LGKPELVIGVLVKEQSTVTFLKDFFKRQGIYTVRFFKSARSLIPSLNKTVPDALIIEDVFLSEVSEKSTKFPVIAIIADDVNKGIEISGKTCIRKDDE